MTFAERLKQARTEAGFTQTQLAKLIGMSQGAIGNWEAGSRFQSASVPRLASVLGVSAIWLAEGKGDIKASAPTAKAGTGNPLLDELVGIASRLTDRAMIELIIRAKDLLREYPAEETSKKSSA